MNSFHALMKAKSAVTAIAGRAAGSDDAPERLRRGVAPSTIAASSRSTGMASNAPRSWKIAKGTAVDA